MRAGPNHQHTDWEQQLERLSAYLDNEVDETERATLEQHLPTCEDCRRALGELSETRALLRALPAPALPRSFLLPETGAIPQPIITRDHDQAIPASPARRAHLARTLQWVGGLAAVLGLLILITTTLSATRNPSLASGGSSTEKAPISSSAHQQSSTQAKVPSYATGNTHNPTHSAQPTVAPTSHFTNVSPVSGENILSLGSIAGAALVIGGASLLAISTLFFRRRMRF